MSQGAQSIVLLMFISVVPSIGVAAYAYRNRDKPGARGFLFCLFGMIGWSLMLMFITWPSQILPVHLNMTGRFFFQIMVAFGWVLLVWEYVHRDSIRIPPVVLAGVALIPVISLILAATNPLHHLVVLPETPDNPAGISEFVLGPWYLVHICFAILMVMLPAGLLIADFRGAHGQHRNQILLLLGGWAIGFPGAIQTHLFRNIDAIPAYVDLTPVTFLIASLFWGLALYQSDLFTIVPVSRRTAIETMADPIVSLDGSETVVDANPPAQELLGAGKDVIGTSFDELRERFPALADLETGTQQQTELTLETDGGNRHFLLDMRKLDLGSATSGSVLVFREVTQLRERERELELLKEIFSRVFRHNVRNRLTAIDGYTTLINQRDTEGTYEEELSRINESSEQLLAHSQKATELGTLIDSDTESVEVDLPAVVADCLDELSELTSATVVVDIDDELLVECHPLVGEAIRELLDNAVSHHPDQAPQIWVSTAVEGDNVSLRIEDDGAGVSLDEIKAITERTETSLTHGSGVGLWLVEMLALKSGGSFSLTDSQEFGGTRAELQFPRAQ